MHHSDSNDYEHNGEGHGRYPVNPESRNHGMSRDEEGGFTISQPDKPDRENRPKPPPVMPARTTIQSELPTQPQVQAPPDETVDVNQLVELNARLRNDLRELAKAADEAIQRERERKVQKMTGHTTNKDPELNSLMKNLKDKNDQLERCKTQITALKRQLDKSYQLSNIKTLEDEFRNLERQFAEAQSENESLKKIQNEQSKALGYLKNEEEYDTKLKEVKASLAEVRAENKVLITDFMEKERLNKRAHEKIIRLEERCRNLQGKIKAKKAGGKTEIRDDEEEIPEEITPALIAGLEDQLKKLDEEQEQVNAEFEAELKNLNRHKRDLELQQMKLQTILKEKEKELRLFSLRMKEIKKLVRFNAVKPLETKKSASKTGDDRKSGASHDVSDSISKNEAKRSPRILEDEMSSKRRIHNPNKAETIEPEKPKILKAQTQKNPKVKMNE